MSILKKINDQNPLIGGWIVMDGLSNMDIMGNAGFDYLVIDGQHGFASMDRIHQSLLTLSHRGIDILLRVPMIEDWYFQKIYDLGVSGIIVPNIKTVAEVKQVVQLSRYPPNGIRGISTSMIRATEYGNNKKYINTVNIDIIIQIETKEAVENLDEILLIEGVSGFFIGPKDLAGSYGGLNKIQTKEFQDIVSKIEQKILQKKKVLVGGTSVDQVNTFFQKGYKLLTIGSDAAILAHATSSMIKQIKQGETNVS